MRNSPLAPRLEWSVIASVLLALAGVSCGSENGGAEPGGAGRRPKSDAEITDPDPDEDAGAIYTLDGEVEPDAETIPESCGDGVRLKDSEEQCDDGNNQGGDGCSARCELERGYNCDPNGGGCMPICGDGVVVGKEACDDMGAVPGDGCSPTCAIEAGWACPSEGQACVPARCGDAIEVGAEACDYGDDSNGDGCSDQCKVETGWTCGAGVCAAASCGDGVRAGSERCDDRNTAATDGCSADCTAIEAFFSCPAGGGACGKVTHCGDGIFTGDEGCDDGDNDDGDGCSARCTIEDGYACPSGNACAPVCGDGKVRGTETCDDSNAASAGCSTSCQIETGYKCPPTGGACSVAVCGNNVTEGLEQCDDTALGQVDQPYDGCYQCKREPACSSGACSATCGDGIKFPNEVCDDGNTRSGDGCSANCTTLEAGFSCQVVEPTPPATIQLPVIYRDFKSDGLSGGHPDFNRQDNATGSEKNLVWDRLGVDANNDGVPDNNVAAGSVVFNANRSSASTTTSTAANFNQWYHDSVPGKRLVLPMTFTRAGNTNTYQFFDRTFYPLDNPTNSAQNKGWTAPLEPAPEALLGPDSSSGTSCGAADQNTNTSDPDRNVNHNYGFTSEVRFWFTYKGGEKLTFTGDDDVWVFIAGKRVIDLGGVHCAESASVLLNAGDAQVDLTNNGSYDTTIALGLQVGFVYEAVIFQAERNPTQSSYRLTLGQFFTPRTECTAVCGDGIRTASELCDGGGMCVGGSKAGEACSTTVVGACPGGTCQTLNDGGYGHCGATCSSRGSHCGDQVKDSVEGCDSGAASNNGAYNGCNPNCTLGPRCGDGSLDASAGEKCDQGSANRDGMYGVCSTSCQFGPRCGDGVVQTAQGEECDDRVNKASYNGCAPNCKYAPSCGDGVVQSNQGEQCDLGKDSNTGMYGACNANCTRASYCGDKMLDVAGGEECDDGNANNFDGCSMHCKAELVLL